VSVDEKHALAIPREALVRMGEYNVVFVESSEADGHMTFERLPVDVDEREASPWLEVKHGLDPGQKVVTTGAAFLSQKL
jgi:multidrug efflux pump subunit AcrA (membrane-fusion protein)